MTEVLAANHGITRLGAPTMVLPPQPHSPDVLDLSHWNTIADWDTLRHSGIVGIIHKFSQGTGYRDPAFPMREYIASTIPGLLWGRYHFGTSEDVPAQVTAFLDGWQPNEAVALDWEDWPDAQMSLSEADEFVQAVFDRIGVMPIIYSGHTLKEAMVANPTYDGVLLQCRLWLAEYGLVARLPRGYSHYWLWQFSGGGRIPGVGSPTDLNRSMYDGSPAELQASWAPAYWGGE